MYILYLHKNYKQSAAGVDFVRYYRKIGATIILMNAEICLCFLLQTVNTLPQSLAGLHSHYTRANRYSQQPKF